MNNPQVYPRRLKENVELTAEDQKYLADEKGIDLLSHVAIAAMNGFISNGKEFGYPEKANTIKASFNYAEAFLKERSTRLNKIK